MSLNSPLNKVLYALLTRHFGEVEIKNPGVPMQFDYIFDPTTKRLRLVIIDSGEEYLVSCDRCRDRRKRLSINANWYYRDQVHGQTWSHLINCFNEDCYRDHYARAGLYARLQDCRCTFRRGNLATARQVAGPPVDYVPTQELPPGFRPLRNLPEGHQAIQYLVKRGFDPEEIDRLYEIGFCESDDAPFHARRRIIIPSFVDGECVGWQARYVGEIDFKAGDAPPKYYTCPGMKRGQVVYNLDQARHFKTVVIVEGPTDVWRVGPMAVAIWGCTLSFPQKQRLLKHCREHSVVLMLDPEIMNPTTRRQIQMKLRNLVGTTQKFGGGLALVSLPPETDPGSLDRAWLRQFIKEQAAERGVRVSWTKRS